MARCNGRISPLLSVACIIVVVHCVVPFLPSLSNVGFCAPMRRQNRQASSQTETFNTAADAGHLTEAPRHLQSSGRKQVAATLLQSPASQRALMLMGTALASGIAFAAHQKQGRVAMQARSADSLEFDPANVSDASTSASSGYGSWKAWGVAGLAAAFCFAVSVKPAFAEDAAQEDDGGWFGGFVDLNAGLIAGIDGILEDGLGVPNSFGYAIIIYTCLIKVLTFPLNQGAGRTTALMQMLQPRMQLIQKKYGQNSEMTSKMTMRLYDEAGVNVFAGCVGPLLQLPIFIGLYQAIQKLAKTDVHFQESFLWIPNLAGPADVGNPSMDWLLKSQSASEFIPLVGWENAGLYLILPAAVMVVQIIVSRLTATQQQEGFNAALPYIFSVFIGYISLISPQGLALYWFINNLLSGAQTVAIRSGLTQEFPQYAKVLSGEASVPDVSDEVGGPARVVEMPTKGFKATKAAKDIVISDDDDLEAQARGPVTKQSNSRMARRKRNRSRAKSRSR